MTGTTFCTKAQGMRIQINIGLSIGIIFILYTKPIQFDLSKYYLYIYDISFPATNIAKKHPMVEDTVDAKLLADSQSHVEQFRL